MTHQNQTLNRGKSKKEILWGGSIRKSTATAMGRTGVVNKAGIDNQVFVVLLRGNLDEGDSTT